MADNIDICSSSNISNSTMNLDARSQGQISSRTESECMMVNFSTFQFYDDSKDMMSTRTSNIVSNVIHTVFFPLLFLVGFPSNIVNMVVFFRHGLKQRMNLCLFCLSVADLVLVTMALLLHVEKIKDQDFTASYRNVGRLSKALVDSRMLSLFSSSSVASQFISAIIAGERCLCIVRPLQSMSLLTTRDVGIVLLVGVLLILGGRFVVVSKHQVICVMDSVTGLTSYLVIGSDFYRNNKKLVDTLDGMVYGLSLPFAFFTVVIIATVIMAVNLHKSAEFQKESSSSTAASSDRNLAVTRMLIYLSIQFIVLNMPTMLGRISLFFLPELSLTGRWANLYYFLSSICELGFVLNSSLNFLIYYFFGSKYRKSVLEMLCKRINANP